MDSGTSRLPGVPEDYREPEDIVAAVSRLEEENERLRDERAAVIDCVNLYGDRILHDALDAAGLLESRRGQ